MKSILYLALILSVSAAKAAETEAESDSDRPLSSISFEGGGAGDGQTFGSLGADIGLSNGDLVSVSGSSSRVKDDQTDEDSVTRAFSAGYTFSPDGAYSLTPSFESWGARSDLETHSFLFDVTFNFEDWSLGFQPEAKTLEWARADQPEQEARTRAGGLHLHAAYVGLPGWMFLLKAGGTGYGGERFDNFLYETYVTDSAFALSSGLVKNYSSFITSYSLASWTFALSLGKAVYLVGDETSKSAGIDVKYQIQDQWTVGYNHTGSRVGDSKTRANALNLAYAW